MTNNIPKHIKRKSIAKYGIVIDYSMINHKRFNENSVQLTIDQYNFAT